VHNEFTLAKAPTLEENPGEEVTALAIVHHAKSLPSRIRWREKP
jgi:hypothetical protein